MLRKSAQPRSKLLQPRLPARLSHTTMLDPSEMRQPVRPTHDHDYHEWQSLCGCLGGHEPIRRMRVSWLLPTFDAHSQLNATVHNATLIW